MLIILLNAFFPFLSIIYAILITVCYLIGFIAIQANTIATSVNTFLNIPVIVTGFSVV